MIIVDEITWEMVGVEENSGVEWSGEDMKDQKQFHTYVVEYSNMKWQ